MVRSAIAGSDAGDSCAARTPSPSLEVSCFRHLPRVLACVLVMAGGTRWKRASRNIH